MLGENLLPRCSRLCGVAACHDHARPAAGEAARGLEAEAAVRAGHGDDPPLQIRHVARGPGHGLSSAARRRPVQWSPRGGDLEDHPPPRNVAHSRMKMRSISTRYSVILPLSIFTFWEVIS